MGGAGLNGSDSCDFVLLAITKARLSGEPGQGGKIMPPAVKRAAIALHGPGTAGYQNGYPGKLSPVGGEGQQHIESMVIGAINF